jgi:hypothetical protein
MGDEIGNAGTIKAEEISIPLSLFWRDECEGFFFATKAIREHFDDLALLPELINCGVIRAQMGGAIKSGS